MLGSGVLTEDNRSACQHPASSTQNLLFVLFWTQIPMREFIADLGYAARALRNNPGFAVVAILLLACLLYTSRCV